MAASLFALSFPAFPADEPFDWADDMEEEIARKDADAKDVKLADDVEEEIALKAADTGDAKLADDVAKHPDNLPVAQCIDEPAPNNDYDSDIDSDTDTDTEAIVVEPTPPDLYSPEYRIGFLSTVEKLGPKGKRLAKTFHDGDMVLNNPGRREYPQPVLWQWSYLSIVENIDDDIEQPPPPPITSLPPPIFADFKPLVLPLSSPVIAAIEHLPSPPITPVLLASVTTPEPPMLALPLPIPPPTFSEPLMLSLPLPIPPPPSLSL